MKYELTAMLVCAVVLGVNSAALCADKIVAKEEEPVTKSLIVKEALPAVQTPVEKPGAKATSVIGDTGVKATAPAGIIGDSGIKTGVIGDPGVKATAPAKVIGDPGAKAVDRAGVIGDTGVKAGTRAGIIGDSGIKISDTKIGSKDFKAGVKDAFAPVDPFDPINPDESVADRGITPADVHAPGGGSWRIKMGDPKAGVDGGDPIGIGATAASGPLADPLDPTKIDPGSVEWDPTDKTDPAGRRGDVMPAQLGAKEMPPEPLGTEAMPPDPLDKTGKVMPPDPLEHTPARRGFWGTIKHFFTGD